MTESILVDKIWGFSYSERWLQSLQMFAFVFVFTALAMLAAAKVRHVK